MVLPSPICFLWVDILSIRTQVGTVAGVQPVTMYQEHWQPSKNNNKLGWLRIKR